MDAEPSVTEYRLYVPTVIRLAMVAPVVFLVLVSIFLFAVTWLKIGESAGWWVGFVPLLISAFFFGLHAFVPYRIRWRENDIIEFVALARTRSIPVADLISIKSDSGQIGALRIKHRRGSFRLWPQFDNFHEFLARLKNANPNIEMRGC